MLLSACVCVCGKRVRLSNANVIFMIDVTSFGYLFCYVNMCSSWYRLALVCSSGPTVYVCMCMCAGYISICRSVCVHGRVCESKDKTVYICTHHIT